MNKYVLLFFIVFSLQITIAQEYEMIRHQVQLGETVRMISRKYKIEPAEIYRLNKFAVDGISQGQVLQLFVPAKEQIVETSVTDSTMVAQNDDEVNTSTATRTVTTTTIRKKKTNDGEPIETETADEASTGDLGVASSAVTHTVSSGETLSGIAMQYGVSVSDIKSQNEKVLKRGLQPGQVLAIIKPVTEVSSDAKIDETLIGSESSQETAIQHKVEKGDTLFHLAKKYNVSVDQIKMQNEPLLKKGLRPGQVLTITTTN
jgi:LysM repeat protein